MSALLDHEWGRSCAADQILALVSGYAPRHRASKHMVMLQAYVDDSASDTGDRRFFLCAYVNTAEKWVDFSASWDDALRANPSIDYFKMSEAQNRSGQFRGWSEADRDQKVLILAKTIKRYRPWSIECSVSREKFDRILKPAAPYPLQSPYFGCFYGVMWSLARYHRAQNITVPTDFIFDEQGGAGHDAAMSYDWLKQSMKHEWAHLLGATPIFRDDKKVVPLQAADMLAWHMRRDREGVDPPNSRPAMDFLFPDFGHIAVDLDGQLEGLAKQFRRVPGVKAVQNKASWNKTRRETRARIAAGGKPPNTNLVWMWARYVALYVKGAMGLFKRR